MSELELKFAIEPGAERRLVRRLRQIGAGEAGLRTLRLRSIYFDTADLDLASAGIALRLRRDGRRWVQTAKLQARLVAGLSSVEEIENAVHGANLDLGRIGDPAALEAILQAVGGKPLLPVFETLVRRRLCLLEVDGTSAEVALDDGVIVAGERREEIREAEIEHKAGDPAGIFKVAGLLFPEGGAIPSVQSKASRGFRLLESATRTNEAGPRLAFDPEILPGTAAEEAAREILLECIAQIGDNIAFVRADARPEGPHQLRVGLRRLRSAMALLRSAIGCPSADRLRQEARWLAAEVGALRDLDALVNDIILPSAKFHVGETTLLPLALAFSPSREKQLAKLRATLAGKRVQDFVLDLLCLVHTRGWRQVKGDDIASDAGQPVEAIAADALDAVWRRVCKRARQIETLDIEARHELRKELKKLRYAIEFLGSLYQRRKVRPFLKRLKTLQETFGFLNDSAMAGRLLSLSGLADFGIAGHDRAVGWISGEAQAKADAAWKDAMASWDGLRQARPFWR